MIKGLFCHYLPIYKDIDGNYCSTTLTNDLFSRYFCVVDELYVATRVYPINKTYSEAHQELINLKNVNIIEFPNLSNLKGFFLELPKARKKIQQIAKNMDLIFIRGGVIALLGVTAARKLHKPYLIECAGCAWDEYWNYSFSGKIIAPYMEYRAKKDTKNASHVIYVTEKWLQNRYPTNGKHTNASNVILNAIDDNALTKRLEKITTFDHKNIHIGTTGGVGNKAKGQQFVIEAISKLSQKYNITYELVGSGDNTYLLNMAKKFNVEDKVVFKGQLTHEEVLEWLDSLDFYIQPSMQEGLPRALIEAMSRACPAIGSTTAGIPELLEPQYIFKRGKVKDLIRVMNYSFDNELREIVERNFLKSKEYQIDNLNKRRTALYKDYLMFIKGE
ncbi:glycosyltransferase family 4 protein [Treponema sp.]|uniref:glycosyltransferase family 4 protein n=1 Tax=Treponema sp. TaxID=166 RepID=UPI00388D0992